MGTPNMVSRECTLALIAKYFTLPLKAMALLWGILDKDAGVMGKHRRRSAFSLLGSRARLVSWPAQRGSGDVPRTPVTLAR